MAEEEEDWPIRRRRRRGERRDERRGDREGGADRTMTAEALEARVADLRAELARVETALEDLRASPPTRRMEEP